MTGEGAVAWPALRGFALAVSGAVLVGLGAWVGIGAVGPGGVSSSLSGSVPLVGLPSGDSVFAPLPGAPAGPLGASQRAGLDSAYGRLPLAFEPNLGQADPHARFVARGAGYSLFLTRRAAALSLVGGARGGRQAALSLGFAGASPHAVVSGQAALPGRVSYLIGSDRSRWRSGVPTYSRVHYRDLWPGIGASFYGNQGRLEYDLTVAPGADPGLIALSFGGASGVRVQPGGALRIALPGGIVRQLQPGAYQVVGGIHHPVASRYVIRGGRVRVHLGSYDHRLPLVIDPVIVYSTYLGGSGLDEGLGIAVDSVGNAYITGQTGSANFPVASSTGTPFQTSNHGTGGGNTVAFVTKLNPAGTALVYSTYLGGSGGDGASGIALDSSGNAYLTGFTSSSDFPTASSTGTPFQTSNHGAAGSNSVAFVTKLNQTGTGLVYSTYLGGSGDDGGDGIAIDGSGNAYVTGFTFSSDFPTASSTGTPFQTSNHGAGGSNDVAFVTKVNPNGTGLVYSTYLGGSGADIGNGIALDGGGNAYVTGKTSSTDFPVASATGTPFQTAKKGGSNAFMTKMNPAGTGLVYSTYLGGSATDSGNAIAVNASGAAYVTGSTSSHDFPIADATSSPFQGNKRGSGSNTNAFVTKLNPSGTGLVYSTYLGGSSNDRGNGIAIDSTGAAWVTGQTHSTDFPAHGTYAGGTNDVFVDKLSPAGDAVPFSALIGGSLDDRGFGIALDFTGAAYITGETSSLNWPVADATGTPFQLNYGGGSHDAFVLKESGPPLVVTGAASGVTQNSVTLNGSVFPNSDQTTYHFDIGTTPSYVSSTAETAVGSDAAFHAVAQTLTPFTPGTTVHYRVVATNSAGTAFGADQTVTTPGGAAGAGPAVSPAVGGLELTPTAFRALPSGPSAVITRPRGSRVSFSLDQAATVTFGVQRRARGRSVGGRCRKPTAGNRRRRPCTRFVAVRGTFTFAGKAGANGFRFTGRLNGRRLRPRRYRLTATPAANGRTGATVNANFRITRR